MPVSRAMRRLLRVRELEEEQGRLALESALGELNRLKNALAAAAGRDRKGRHLVASSVVSGELPDRLAGLEESRSAARLRDALSVRTKAAELDAAAVREDFLLRKVERRQAQSLIEHIEARDAVEAGRRDQQALDEWHRSRLVKTKAEVTRERDAALISETEGAASPNDGNLAD